MQHRKKQLFPTFVLTYSYFGDNNFAVFYCDNTLSLPLSTSLRYYIQILRKIGLRLRGNKDYIFPS